MAIEYRNDCNGCAECVHCGLNKRYPVRVCDECGMMSEDVTPTIIYRYNRKDFCTDCLIQALIDDGIIYEVTEDDD